MKVTPRLTDPPFLRSVCPARKKEACFLSHCINPPTLPHPAPLLGLAGALAGAGGGAAQTVVIAPLTYVVTAAVTNTPRADGTKEPLGALVSRTYAAHGVKGFYPGGSAIALRQMSNWASRQGFTEWARGGAKKFFHGADGPDVKLSAAQEAAAGVVGGTLACWNHPIEVARIEAQARANAGQPALSIAGIGGAVVRERGPAGRFAGVGPRVLLGVWQTLCMVTGVSCGVGWGGRLRRGCRFRRVFAHPPPLFSHPPLQVKIIQSKLG